MLAYKYWDYIHDEFNRFVNKNIKNWTDSEHLSKYGAESFSKAVSKLIKMNSQNTSDYFYKTYDEYLSTVDIANLWMELGKNGIKAKCTHGTMGTPMFKFYGKKSGEENWELIRDYTQDEFLDKVYFDKKYTEIKVYGKLDKGILERYAIIKK